MDERVEAFIESMRGLRAPYTAVFPAQRLLGDTVAVFVLGGGHIHPGRVVVVPSHLEALRCRWCSYATFYRESVFGKVQAGGRTRSVIDDIQVMCQDCANLWRAGGNAGRAVMQRAVVRHLRHEQLLLAQQQPSERLNTHGSMVTLLGQDAAETVLAAERIWQVQSLALERLRQKALPPFRAWQRERQAEAARRREQIAARRRPDDVLGDIEKVLGSL